MLLPNNLEHMLIFYSWMSQVSISFTCLSKSKSLYINSNFLLLVNVTGAVKMCRPSNRLKYLCSIMIQPQGGAKHLATENTSKCSQIQCVSGSLLK